MEKLEIFIRVSCQFFVVNGPLFEEIFGGDVKMTFYMRCWKPILVLR